MSKQVFIFILLIIVAHLSGCASAGYLNYEDKIYTLNHSNFFQEHDGKYRIWAWRYERGGLLNIVGGSSPAGVQMLLPANACTNMPCEINKGCMLWVRGHESELLHVLFGLNGRWIGADKGKITVSEWDLENNIFAGRFEVQVENTPVTGEFLVSSATKSD